LKKGMSGARVGLLARYAVRAEKGILLIRGAETENQREEDMR